MILSTAYLGNVQYYTKLLSGRAQIDLHEHYQKQSCRNRCDILSAGGPTTLVVPVCRPSGERVPVRDIRIDRTKKWRHQHFQALVSAYRRSPYFGYYEERFAVVYRKRHDFLVDLNEELQSLVLELLRADPPVGHTERYAEHVPEGEDFRRCISRKPRLSRPDPDFAPQPYYQVFSERMPFVPNLSIVDLLFCEGPSAAGRAGRFGSVRRRASVACSLTEGGARPDDPRLDKVRRRG